MRRYEAYKESGVAWVEEIPDNWQSILLKRVAIIFNGATPKSDEQNWDGDITWITPSDIGRIKDDKYIFNSERRISKIGLNSCGCSLVKAGSIVLTTRAPIGNLLIAGIEFATNQGCKSIIPKDNIGVDYVYYFLKSKSDVLNILGQGTTFQELPTRSLESFFIPLPPPPEQHQIVAYLDAKTAQIDGLVALKEQKIALLNEYRTALIDQAVTKGLDPSVPTKDSGVEWIGEIPSNWCSIQLKRVAVIINGATPKSDEQNWDGDITWITPSDIGKIKDDKYIFNSERRLSKIGLDSCGCSLVKAGSIVLTTRAPIGNLLISQIEFATNQGCKSIVPMDNIGVDYLYYFLKSKSDVLNILGQGTTFQELPTRSLESFFIPLPPLPEQHQIVAYLDAKTAQIDRRVALEKQKIALLKEYRQSLISAVVTGKIDVRTEVPVE